MSAKITTEVLEHAKRLAAEGGEEGIQVVVTLAAGMDLAALEERGLAVQQVWESISAVAGRIAPGRLSELAALAEVELIEHDGPVHAFDEP